MSDLLYQSLQPLIHKIEQGLAEQCSELGLIEHFLPEFQALLSSDQWLPQRYRQENPERYQQFLLYKDQALRFSIVSFVWDKGQRTPIHNHEVWGVVGVLQGEEFSQRYQRDRNGAFKSLGSIAHLKTGQIDFFTPDQGDIHQVSNALADQVSISIHVYGADIGAVQRYTFTENGTAKAFVSGYSNTGDSNED